jgi:hypothetical protein
VIGFGRCRFKNFESIFDESDEFRVLAELSWIELSHSIERSVDIITIQPTFMTPTESHQKPIKCTGIEVPLCKRQKFSTAS